MGTALARRTGLGDANTIMDQQKAQLLAFMVGLKTSLLGLVATFNVDVATMPADQRTVAQRILERATTVGSHIDYEVQALSAPPSPMPEAWFRQHIEDGREIVRLVTELSEDMVGFLQTGRIPSEDEKLKEMALFGIAAAAIAGLGYYFWWRSEKEAESLQESMLESGEIEQCSSCSGG